MIFLRLFRAHRALEAELAESAAARIKAEDENRALYAKVEVLEKSEREARQDAVWARERIADWLAKRSNLGTIFRDPDQVPKYEPPKPEAFRDERLTGREAVDEDTRLFQQQVADLLKQKQQTQ